MRWIRHLTGAATGMTQVYRIVFTGMMLYELAKYGLRRKRENAAIFNQHRGGRSGGVPPGKRDKEARP